MSNLVRDLRVAFRALRKGWMVSALAVISLALAIGGNAAVFSMVDAFLFRPLPYPSPETIVLVGEIQRDQPPGSGQLTTSRATAADYAERSRTLTDWAMLRPQVLNLRGTERSEPVSGVAATPEVFSVLAAQPVRGRLFTAEEAVEGGPRVVLLGWDFWVERWGEGVDAVGETLVLSGDPHEIIGVLPRNFGFLTPNQDLWVPLQESRTTSARDQRTLLAFGRMATGVSMEDVRAELGEIASALESEYAETMRGWVPDVYNMRYDIPTAQSRILFAMLQASVLLVLAIACVNITNLLLARGQERSREIAVRTVLGATRVRIVRQLLTESFLMVAAGAAIGIGLGALGVRALSAQFAGVLPPGFEIVMDGRVLLFTLAVSGVAGLLFGLAPALQTLKAGQSAAIREGGGRGGSARSRHMVTRGLIVGEIALSFVALGGGLLLIQSFLSIRSGDPGFEAGPVLTGQLSIPASRYPAPEDRHGLNERLLESARTLPGVESAALTSLLPQSPLVPADSFRVEGAAVDPGLAAPSATVIQASPGYAAVFDIGLYSGRFFESLDRLDAAPVVVIDRSLADAHFAGRSPLGERLLVRGESREIIGVAENVQQVLLQSGGAENGETIYLPSGQVPTGNGFIVLRSDGDPLELQAPLRTAVETLDRDLTLAQVLTLEDYIEQFWVGVNVFNVVLGAFGLIALLLASLGTYGVLAYSVNRRSHEIGIRMALGAHGRSVVSMVARQGLWLGLIGLAIGGALMVPLVGLMNSALQGLSGVQPVTLVAVAGVLFAVTMTASFVPAWRAARVDPMNTLRGD